MLNNVIELTSKRQGKTCTRSFAYQVLPVTEQQCERYGFTPEEAYRVKTINVQFVSPVTTINATEWDQNSWPSKYHKVKRQIQYGKKNYAVISCRYYIMHNGKLKFDLRGSGFVGYYEVGPNFFKRNRVNKMWYDKVTSMLIRNGSGSNDLWMQIKNLRAETVGVPPTPHMSNKYLHDGQVLTRYIKTAF